MPRISSCYERTKIVVFRLTGRSRDKTSECWTAYKAPRVNSSRWTKLYRYDIARKKIDIYIRVTCCDSFWMCVDNVAEIIVASRRMDHSVRYNFSWTTDAIQKIFARCLRDINIRYSQIANRIAASYFKIKFQRSMRVHKMEFSISSANKRNNTHDTIESSK